MPVMLNSVSVYGVVCLQVLNVTLQEGENAVLEDLGGLEPSILANKSGLIRGLVVKSSSNQISIRFTSQEQLRPGSLLLRYRGETSSKPQQRFHKVFRYFLNIVN